MELNPAELETRYGNILETCQPYLVSYPGNYDFVDRAPFGFRIEDDLLFDPTRLRSRHVIDGLHHLDAFSFGGQEMLMPRWVLFDCGEFPGIVFGFGRYARDCKADVREAYKVLGHEHDDTFVPLSMWVALHNLETGAFFGHNLSSANLVAKQEPLPGLGTITKAFGVKVAKASKQYGATQWDSSSLGIHMSLGEMKLLNAYTPAHTHVHSFTYRIDVEAERLSRPLRPGFSKPDSGGDRCVVAGDESGILQLQKDIEAGAAYVLHRMERVSGEPQRLWLKNA